MATDHLQKTVFYYVDVIRLLYPAWSPHSGRFPFSMTDSDGETSMSPTSYASNIDAGVRAMLLGDVSGDVALDVDYWVGNTSAFLLIVGDATGRVHRLLTFELDSSSARATSELVTGVVILFVVLALSPVIFLLIYRMTLTIQNYALGLSKKTKELRREKKRSDTLLYQMLPKSVALQLKLSKKV